MHSFPSQQEGKQQKEDALLITVQALYALLVSHGVVIEGLCAKWVRMHMQNKPALCETGVCMNMGAQGFIYVNNDEQMVDPASGQGALARNTNLNEDLGKVEYVFSDKTGTLTSNEMQLREVALKGAPFGDARFKCAPRRLPASSCLPRALVTAAATGMGNSRTG